MSYQKTIAICLYCGTEFEKYREDHVYCGPECRKRARSEKDWVEIPPERLCVHNEGVKCSPRDRNCDSCVWNPPVDKARKQRRMKELGLNVHDI